MADQQQDYNPTSSGNSFMDFLGHLFQNFQSAAQSQPGSDDPVLQQDLAGSAPGPSSGPTVGNEAFDPRNAPTRDMTGGNPLMPGGSKGSGQSPSSPAQPAQPGQQNALMPQTAQQGAEGLPGTPGYRAAHGGQADPEGWSPQKQLHDMQVEDQSSPGAQQNQSGSPDDRQVQNDSVPPLEPNQNLKDPGTVAASTEPTQSGSFDYPSDLKRIFQPLESKYGLPTDYLARTAKIESNFNNLAHNKGSNAQGGFQFVPGTAKQYGVTNPEDWQNSADGAARLAVDNMNALKKGGIDSPTGSMLYLAHQQGAGGALALLQHPDMPAAQALSQYAGLSPQAAAAHIKSNGGDPNAPSQNFFNMWDSKFNGGGDYSSHTNIASAPDDSQMHPAIKAAAKRDPALAMAIMSAMMPGYTFHPVSYDPRSVEPPAIPWQNVG